MDERLIEKTLHELIKYVIKEEFKGYDPYDSLLSPLSNYPPLTSSKLLRQLWTQLFKRSPLNLRPLFKIPKTRNPKGIGLFISGFSTLYRIYRDEFFLDKSKELIDWLKKQSSPQFKDYFVWGYNFPWQSRDFFVPPLFPNVVTTVFVSMALLDYFEITEDEDLLQMVESAGEFLLRFHLRKGDKGIWLSYTPIDSTIILNVSFWGSAFLARLSTFVKKEEYRTISRNVMAFGIEHQRKNGSWPYGISKSQSWIDNFHTGYNLMALKTYLKFLKDEEAERAAKRGFQYYNENFFLKSGIPKYYNNKIYPIDTHSIAQGILVYLTYEDFDPKGFDKAKKIAQWAIRNMRNPDRGFFYFQKHKFYTIKIPYIRWSEAWMFLSLTKLLERFKN